MTNGWLGGLFLQPRKIYFKMLKVWVIFPYFEYYYINNNISYCWPLRAPAAPLKTQDGEGVTRWVLTRSALYWHNRAGRWADRSAYNQLQSMNDILGPPEPTNQTARYWVLMSWPYPVYLCSLLYAQWSMNSALLSVLAHVHHRSVLLCSLDACEVLCCVEWPTSSLFGKRWGLPQGEIHQGCIFRFGTVCRVMLPFQKLLGQIYIQ